MKHHSLQKEAGKKTIKNRAWAYLYSTTKQLQEACQESFKGSPGLKQEQNTRNHITEDFG
jgi:hypothetical protein